MMMILLNNDRKEETYFDSNTHMKWSKMHITGHVWTFGNDV